jgi:NitT/TauT family transport system substrate-binding protein
MSESVFTRRRLLISAGAGLTLLATGCASDDDAGSGDGSSPTVRLGWFPAFHTVSAFIADKAGLFTEQKVKVEMISGDSGATLNNLLSAGQVDLTYAALEVVANAQAQGRDLIQVAPLVSRFTLNTVVRNAKLQEIGIAPDAPIQDRLNAFARMKIGYTAPNAPTDRYARYFMGLGGVDPETEGTLVSVGSAANLQAALKTGQIDAYMLTPPGPDVPVLQGYGTIFIRGTAGDVLSLADVPDTGLGVRKSWVEKEANAEALIGVLTALIKGNRLLHDDPTTAAGHVKPFFPDMAPEVMKVAIKEITPAIPTTPELSEQTVSHALDVLFNAKLVDLKERPSSKEGGLWTAEYLNEAKRRVGA